MKKTINFIRIAVIALYPIILLTLMGCLEFNTKMMAARTFNPMYNLWLMFPYAFSGLVIAFNCCCEKEFYRRKLVFFAHIFSGVSIFVFCTLWFLNIFGVLFVGKIYLSNLLISIPIGVLSLMLGYILFTTIRAVMIYFKRK